MNDNIRLIFILSEKMMIFKLPRRPRSLGGTHLDNSVCVQGRRHAWLRPIITLHAHIANQSPTSFANGTIKLANPLINKPIPNTNFALLVLAK